MRIAGIVRDSVVDGEGIRDVIFVQGCSHHCKGCHNQHTWRHDGGEHRFVGSIINELSNSDNDITISGGEPLDQWYSLVRLLELIRSKTNKRVWLYTGNTVDVNKYIYQKLSKYVDVVVDGKFVKSLKDKDLQFRGSSNQRIIDLPTSIKEKKIVLWRDNCEEYI